MSQQSAVKEEQEPSTEAPDKPPSEPPVPAAAILNPHTNGSIPAAAPAVTPRPAIWADVPDAQAVKKSVKNGSSTKG